MKKFRIPLIDQELHLYIGPKDWEKFKHDVGKQGVDIEKDMKCPNVNSGKAWGGWLWVYGLNDVKTLIHELSHFIDDLMNTLGTDDGEFRAYITGWVTERVLKMREGEMKNEN